MRAILALEDGRTFLGRSFGSEGEAFGEVVFNTSMYGYQEVLTDPSYAGQIVVMTSPHIGNYGTNPEDEESHRPHVEGFAARQFCDSPSNWRSQESLGHYLVRHKIVAISGLDTRALVRHVRSRGAMRGIVSSLDFDGRRLQERIQAMPKMQGCDMATLASCKTPYGWSAVHTGAGQRSFRVVAFDFGIKRSILRHLARIGCIVTVVPAVTSAEDTLALRPDGVFLSNGPGDPEPLEYAVKTIRELLDKVPIFGICLGHQLLGLALGGRTFKLKFGHRGGNHPVKNLITRRVEITAQNHGFAVDPDSLSPGDMELTHINLNDQTLEGFRHRRIPAFSVQYHPEAAPGPHDSHYLFEKFKQLMTQYRGTLHA